MRLLHLTQKIAPFWPPEAGSVAAAEIPQAQVTDGSEVVVIGEAPESSGDGNQQIKAFARRLSPLVVTWEGASLEVGVLEGTLSGSGARLYLLVMPPGGSPAAFGLAAIQLIATLPMPPTLIHLHDITGVNVDQLREALGGATVVQSVYDARLEDAPLAAAIEDADAVITPCVDFTSNGDSDPGIVARALGEHSLIRVVSLGIDTSRWDPERDKALEMTFGPSQLAGRSACRAALQKRAGFSPREDAPIFTVWSRSNRDAGLDLVAGMLDEILDLDVQLVVLRPEGMSDDAPELAPFRDRPRAWVTPTCTEPTLRRILAGSDAVILPDRTATLGGRARTALRYGAVPVARWINAHRDFLVEYDAQSGTGGAFLFDQPEAVELYSALGRLRRAFGDQEVWQSMIRSNLAVDLGWPRAIAQLNEIYRKALAK